MKIVIDGFGGDNAPDEVFMFFEFLIAFRNIMCYFPKEKVIKRVIVHNNFSL